MVKRSDKQARFEILLEEVQSQLKVVVQGHSGLDQKIDLARESLERKIGSLDQKVGSLDGKFESLDQKVESLDQRMGSLDQKMDHGFAMLGQRIGFVEFAVLEVHADVKRIDQRLSEHLSTH